MSEPKRCPPGELGKLLDEARKRIKDILYAVRYGKDDGRDQELAALTAVERLRTAVEGMEKQGKTKSAIIARLSMGLVEAGLERDELKDKLQTARETAIAHMGKRAALKRRLETALKGLTAVEGIVNRTEGRDLGTRPARLRDFEDALALRKGEQDG